MSKAGNLEEIKFQLDIVSGIVNDMDDPRDHELNVVENILSRIEQFDTADTVLKTHIGSALAAIREYRAGYISFEAAYARFCAALDDVQTMVEVLSQGLSVEPIGSSTQCSEVDSGKAAPEEVLAGPPTPGQADGPSLNGVSPDDISSFVSEVDEYLTAGEEAMLHLEKDPSDREAINQVFRCFHNVKGISGFVGLKDAQQVAHGAESLLDRVRSGTAAFSGELSELAFESLDMIRAISENVRRFTTGEKYESPDGWNELVYRLESLAARGEVPHETGPAVSQEAPKFGGESDARTVNAYTRKGEEYVKVAVSNLDAMIDLVGELVTTGSMVTQEAQVYKGTHSRLVSVVDSLGKTIRELQELATGLRMVSLENMFIRMSRVVRDLSVKSGFRVDFTYEGQETELDRGMVEELNSPLVHLIRNAIDHGLEAPKERLAAGKTEVGRVHLSAFHDSGTVVIRVTDDGRGLDRDRIVAKAKKIGLVPHDAVLSDREAYQLIYHPGFSTADRVTDVSGRGVGMDVVKRSVEKLRGRIEVNSQPGLGTEFTIRLPLTMAIIEGMVVTVGKERYIIPTTSIQESMRPAKDQILTVQGKGEMVNIRGSMLNLIRLHRMFNIEGAREDPCSALVIVISDGQERCGLLVDDLVEQQQVVVKPAGKMFSGIGAVSGAAILGDGLVTLILDAGGVMRMAKGVGSL